MASSGAGQGPGLSGPLPPALLFAGEARAQRSCDGRARLDASSMWSVCACVSVYLHCACIHSGTHSQQVKQVCVCVRRGMLGGPRRRCNPRCGSCCAALAGTRCAGRGVGIFSYFQRSWKSRCFEKVCSSLSFMGPCLQCTYPRPSLPPPSLAPLPRRRDLLSCSGFSFALLFICTLGSHTREAARCVSLCIYFIVLSTMVS